MNALILNLTNIKNQKVVLNEADSKIIRSKRLKIGNYVYVKDVLDSNYRYKITGASSLSGTPLRRYSENYNAFKEKVPGRKKMVRALGSTITEDTAVLDLKLEPRIKNPGSSTQEESKSTQVGVSA